MATWSITGKEPSTAPDASINSSTGVASFPANTSTTTNNVYTITYDAGNGCTQSTTYTVEKSASTRCAISLLVTSSMCSISFRADGTYPSCSEFDVIEWGVTTSPTESSFDDGAFPGNETINNDRKEELVDIIQDGDYYVYWRNQNSHDVSGSSKVTLSSCNIPCRGEETINMIINEVLEGFGNIDYFILSPNIVTRDDTTQSYCTFGDAKGIDENRLREKMNNNFHPISLNGEEIAITKDYFISETLNHALLPKDYQYQSEIFSGFNPRSNNASPYIYCYVKSKVSGKWHIWNEIEGGQGTPGCPGNCEDYYNLNSRQECSDDALMSIKVGGAIDFYNQFISHSQVSDCGFNIYMGMATNLGYEGVCGLDEY